MNHKFRGIFKMPFSLSVLCAAALFLGGCSVTRKDFTLVSTIDNAVAAEARKSGERVIGQECHSYMSLFGAMYINQIDTFGAVQAALRKASEIGYRANALANVEINYTYFAIPVLFARVCTIAEGNPVNVEMQ